MHISIITIATLLLLTLSLSARGQKEGKEQPEPRPITISSYRSAFGLQIMIEGTVIQEPNSIAVRVAKIRVRVSEHCPYRGPRTLKSMRLGLATKGNERNFRMVAKSAPIFYDLTMRPGDEHSLEPVNFSLPVRDKDQLRECWIVVQMEDHIQRDGENKPGIGHAYAHSRKDIFHLSRDKGLASSEFASSNVRGKPIPDELKPTNAVEGIIKVFDHFPIVALGEMHWSRTEHDFIGCGSFRTTTKPQKIRLFCKIADLIQVNLPEIWLPRRHISLLPVVT